MKVGREVRRDFLHRYDRFKHGFITASTAFVECEPVDIVDHDQEAFVLIGEHFRQFGMKLFDGVVDLDEIGDLRHRA
ncbi:hypothetical protein CI41S_20420 [Bradyrhizobium ivorense]|nr:hypothetical protein CI41S_20420 [Bradyrhizobium ivorense]